MSDQRFADVALHDVGRVVDVGAADVDVDDDIMLLGHVADDSRQRSQARVELLDRGPR